MKDEDRIVEVNGINVENSQHHEVVSLIKSIDDSVTLLVVDPASDQHFKNAGITVAGHMSSVERIASPDSNPAATSTLTTAGQQFNIISDSVSVVVVVVVGRM